MVPMHTVYVPVCNFFGRCGAHFGDFDHKAQGLSGPRMVAIQMHGVAFDLHNIEYLGNPFIAVPLQLTAHFDPWWKLMFGNGSHKRLITQAECILSGQGQRNLLPRLFSFQRRFNLGKSVFIAPMKINRGLIAIIQRLAMLIGDFDA